MSSYYLRGQFLSRLYQVGILNKRILNAIAMWDRAVGKVLLCLALVLFATCPVRAQPQPIAGPMQTRHVRLNHTSATHLAKLLRTISPDGDPPDTWRPRARAALTRAGIPPVRIEALLEQNIPNLSTGGVTIIPDSSRNALLIRTPALNLPPLLELVKLLDAPSPQVLIEITAVQITHDNSAAIGVDLEYADGHRDPNQLYATVPASATGPVALNYQLISDNIDVFLAALARVGTVEVLSRPQLVITHNALGEISLAHNVPILSDTIPASDHAAPARVINVAAETLLRITPHIDQSGYVSLRIALQTESRAPHVEGSDTSRSPAFIRHSAQTQLRMRQGQTVCLGGLVSDSVSEIETKVWLLGDIPLVGALFRYTQAIPAQTELTIFLTPHIIAAPTQMSGN